MGSPHQEHRRTVRRLLRGEDSTPQKGNGQSPHTASGTVAPPKRDTKPLGSHNHRHHWVGQ